MGIFGRMKTLLKANVNDLASKAEDPEKVLTQLIIDMKDQLSEAKMQVRDSIADQKLLEKRMQQSTAKASDWESKAMKAVEAGRDDLAREALTRKQDCEERATEFHSNLEAQKAQVEQLKVALRGLASKIEEAERRKNILVAKQKRVEAQTQTATTGNAATNTSAFDSFERSAAKIENFEAEVSATAEISDTLKDQELETKFSGLEETHGSDDALAALKAKMGHGEKE